MSDVTLIDEYRIKPDEFFEDVLGIDTLECYQSDVLRRVAKYNRVLIRSSHSTGKTYMMARIALWFYSCFENSLVITTAPTHKQVEKLLWGELRDAYKNSKMPLGGVLLNTQLKKSDKWYCLGLSPQKTAGSSDEQQGSSFQGYHSDHVLIIFDEATGVPPDIWKMAEGLMTSGKIVKFVAIANPTTRACEFYEKSKLASWHSIHLSCFNSPNLRANGFFNKEDIQDEIDRLMMMPEDERLMEISSYAQPTPHLASAQWAIEFCMEWGLDHPLVVSKVFGEFPDDDDSVLIPMNLVTAAFERDTELEETSLRCIGVDVARYGSDKSVLCEMVGTKHTDLLAVAKRSTTVVTGHVINMINNDHVARDTVVLVDATGIGAGVFDNLIEKQQEGIISKKVDIREIHFGASPVNEDEKDQEIIDQDKSRYANLKARMFQLLSNDMRYCIDLINDSNFMKELPTIKSFPDSKGRLRIESKEDYKKRTGRPSPDYSDALALCNLGRYVNITYGSFNKNISSEPIVKQKKRRERRSGVKVSEY
jgi:hypothetical protein